MGSPPKELIEQRELARRRARLIPIGEPGRNDSIDIEYPDGTKETFIRGRLFKVTTADGQVIKFNRKSMGFPGEGDPYIDNPELDEKEKAAEAKNQIRRMNAEIDREIALLNSDMKSEGYGPLGGAKDSYFASRRAAMRDYYKKHGSLSGFHDGVY